MEKALAALLFCFVALQSASAGNREPRTPDEAMSGGTCARSLNGLTTGALYHPTLPRAIATFSWLGNDAVPGTHGWMRLGGRTFAKLMDRAGFVEGDPEEIIGHVGFFRRRGNALWAEPSESLARAASVAAETFFNFDLLGARDARNLYAAFAPPEFDPHFPPDAHVLFLFKPENYGFEAEGNISPAGPSALPQPRRLIEGLLMRQPNFEDNDELASFVGDLLAAIQRWNDWHRISQETAKPPGAISEWLRGKIGTDRSGRVVLTAPYVPLVVELRAETLKAYVRSTLLGSDWEKEWDDALDRAFDEISRVATPIEMMDLRARRSTLYREFVIPAAGTLTPR